MYISCSLRINVLLLDSDKQKSFAELETYQRTNIKFYNHDTTSILLKILSHLQHNNKYVVKKITSAQDSNLGPPYLFVL